MRILLSLFSVLLFQMASGQAPDGTPVKEKPATPGTPLFTVSGDDIRRFPTDNFLDAVNGLFPWVFSQQPSPNDFIFVIDGFVLTDINGLSLYDIDKVAFTRNNLGGSLFPYSRAGIFYITTRRITKVKPLVTFNSQFNTVWNKRARVINRNDNGLDPGGIPGVNESDNKNGYWLNNHLSAGAGNAKWNFYSSVQWDQLRSPEVRQQNIRTSVVEDTQTARQKNRQSQLKLFLRGAYKFSTNVEGGLTLNFVHSPNRFSMGQANQADNGLNMFQVVRDDSRQQYLHLGGFLNWQLLPNLRYEIRPEYQDNSIRYDGTTVMRMNDFSTPVSGYDQARKSNADASLLALRNALQYDIPLKSKWKIGIGTGFTYAHHKTKTRMSVVQEGMLPGSGSISASLSKADQEITVLNPQVSIGYDSLFSIYGGYALLLNKWMSGSDNKTKSNPYAGFTFDLQKALHISGQLNRFELTGHYGDLNRNLSTNAWLPSPLGDPAYPTSFAGVIYGIGSLIAPTNPGSGYSWRKNRLLSLVLQAGFGRDRVVAGLEWTELKRQQYYVMTIAPPSSVPMDIIVEGDETHSGLSVYLSAQVIAQDKMAWMTRVNVLMPNVKEEIDFGQNVLVSGLANTYDLQAGWQNKVSFGAWSLQLHALLGVGRTYSRQPGADSDRKVNELILNYAQVSYTFSALKSKWLGGLDLFAHGRNLLSSSETIDYYQYNSFAGVGVDLRFK